MGYRTGYEIYSIAQLREWKRKSKKAGYRAFAAMCQRAIRNKEEAASRVTVIRPEV